MTNKSQIVFVCEHGAAKSIVASAWFNKLASESGVAFHSIARGTHPEPELSPIALAGLQTDGLTPGETIPQKLTVSDMDSSQFTITFCSLSDEESHRAVDYEHWDDIPAVSDGYEAARDALLNRINHLISELKSSDSQM